MRTKRKRACFVLIGEGSQTLTMRSATVLAAFVVMFFALACNSQLDDESDSSDLPLIPTPVAPLMRESCEQIGTTDYFLSDEEREWFTENCNRLDCDLIRGNQYLSRVERVWYLRECV